MTSIQKILISSLILVFIIITGLIITIKGYNSVIKAEAEVNNTWSQFEALYKLRFDLIQLAAARANKFNPRPEPIMKAQFLSYAQSQTPEARVKAMIEIEKELQRLIENRPFQAGLKNDSEFSNLLYPIESSKSALLPTKNQYDEKVEEYNNKIKQLPLSVLAAYFSWQTKTNIRDLW